MSEIPPDIGRAMEARSDVVPGYFYMGERDTMGLGPGAIITYESDDRVPMTEWQFFTEMEVEERRYEV